MTRHFPIIIEQDSDGIFIVECPEAGLVQRVSSITEVARYEAATHPGRYEHRHSY